jgi:hypothetical protein
VKAEKLITTLGEPDAKETRLDIGAAAIDDIVKTSLRPNVQSAIPVNAIVIGLDADGK